MKYSKCVKLLLVSLLIQFGAFASWATFAAGQKARVDFEKAPNVNFDAEMQFENERGVSAHNIILYTNETGPKYSNYISNDAPTTYYFYIILSKYKSIIPGAILHPGNCGISNKTAHYCGGLSDNKSMFCIGLSKLHTIYRKYTFTINLYLDKNNIINVSCNEQYS